MTARREPKWKHRDCPCGCGDPLSRSPGDVVTAVVLVWLDGPDVYVSDVTGTPRPVAAGHARTLAARADLADPPLVKYGPDWFHRDALTSAAELVDTADTCVHEDKWTRCDNPAPADLTQPRPRCTTHRVEN